MIVLWYALRESGNEFLIIALPIVGLCVIFVIYGMKWLVEKIAQQKAQKGTEQ